MTKREEAHEILRILGLPKPQQNERTSLTLLALAGLTEADSWSAVTRPLLRIWDVMAWMREHYQKDYAANSRETIRRQSIHQLEQARLVDRNPDNPTRPTNSGDTVYQLTEAAAKVLANFGKRGFASKCAQFTQQHGTLAAAYNRERLLHKIPVQLPDGRAVTLSPGPHNVLQCQIIEQFAPRFAAGATVIYLGDTAKKLIVVDTEILRRLQIPELNHEKLPDVVLYDSKRNWLFLIEAVTSHGPVSPKRHAELETTLRNCTADRVYVTAFLGFADFKKYASDIVWESEVWISDFPDHMIHFNGDKFLGPHKRD
ncbi:MAG: BsuBI/PstI family type II restriction endonuclease [Planctomycetota bacterium]|nr:BsuBI/PstI family type II restriction endonuclease [Planctomycetota bacterium]